MEGLSEKEKKGEKALLGQQCGDCQRERSGIRGVNGDGKIK